MAVDYLSLAAVILGLLIGYTSGRYLFARHRLVVPLWPVIAVLVVVGLVTSLIFGAIGLAGFWQAFFFPLLVGCGAGAAVTPARLPRRGAAWWEIWRA